MHPILLENFAPKSVPIFQERRKEFIRIVKPAERKCILLDGNKEIKDFVQKNAEQIIQIQSEGQLKLLKKLIQEEKETEDISMEDGFIEKQYLTLKKINVVYVEKLKKKNYLPTIVMEIEQTIRRTI